jgi:hypothetical protein
MRAAGFELAGKQVGQVGLVGLALIRYADTLAE